MRQSHSGHSLPPNSPQLLIVGTYWPSGSDPSALEQRNELAHTVQNLLTAHPQHIPLIMGDFNGVMQAADRSSTMYEADIAHTQFIKTNNLSPLDCAQQRAPTYRTRSTDPMQPPTHSRIDDILTSTLHKASCTTITDRVLDIGGRLESEKGNFDHHQNENITATNMLILNHFCNDEKLKVLLRKQLFSYVDAVDRGIFFERINPEKLNTDQWCEVALSWGAKEILFVAKHTGGVCWWQTETTDYGIRNTSYKNGTGDVLKELSESCKKYGLNLGIYVYPGDETWGAGIDTTGLIPEEDVQLYKDFGEEINRRFGSSLAEVENVSSDITTLYLPKSQKINHVVTMEDYRQGHRIREYSIESYIDGKWKELYRGLSVGRKKNRLFLRS